MRANTESISVSGVEWILGNWKRKYARENVRRTTAISAGQKTEGGADTFLQDVEKAKEHRHVRF